MALNLIRRICARLIKWFDKHNEEMNQWQEDDPDAYYAFMERQQRNFRGGV